MLVDVSFETSNELLFMFMLLVYIESLINLLRKVRVCLMSGGVSLSKFVSRKELGEDTADQATYDEIQVDMCQSDKDNRSRPGDKFQNWCPGALHGKNKHPNPTVNGNQIEHTLKTQKT